MLDDLIAGVCIVVILVLGGIRLRARLRDCGQSKLLDAEKRGGCRS